MSGPRRRTFPLVPRRPLAGTAFGSVRSVRRGSGTDVVGSRPYVPGDRLSQIDWAASARLSLARGDDEFLVRQTRADDAPRVVVWVDRRPSMRTAPAGLPFLDKPRAAHEAVTAIVASARAARADLAWLDVGADGAHWVPSRTVVSEALVEGLLAREADAPLDAAAQALAALVRPNGEARRGTFVFLVSDFLVPPPPGAWQAAARRSLDLVAVRVQDPVWEAGFPDVAGVLLPVADPAGGRAAGTRLGRADVRTLRAANEERHAALLRDTRAAGADVVEVTEASAPAVDAAFARWGALRTASLRVAAVR